MNSVFRVCLIVCAMCSMFRDVSYDVWHWFCFDIMFRVYPTSWGLHGIRVSRGLQNKCPLHHQRWCKYTFGFIDTQHLLTGHFIRYHILPGPHLLFYALIGMYIVYFGHLQRSLAQTSSEPIISMMSRPKNNCCIDAAADVGSWWLALIKLLYVEYIFVISKSFLGVCSRPWGLQST